MPPLQVVTHGCLLEATPLRHITFGLFVCLRHRRMPRHTLIWSLIVRLVVTWLSRYVISTITDNLFSGTVSLIPRLYAAVSYLLTTSA